MIRHCEDPHNHRRVSTRRHHKVPAAQARPASQAAGPAPGRAERGQDRPSTVSAAVLRGARLSARADHIAVANEAHIGQDRLRDWEQSLEPLASVPFPVIEKLQTALTNLGAQAQLVTDLEVAIWCDLVIEAIVSGEDTSCLMADPTAGLTAFSELLAWSLGDIIPARYRPYAEPGNLSAG